MCASRTDPNHKQLIFTAFDPLKGRLRELTRFDTDPNLQYSSALSPDGTRIAVLRPSDDRINILSFVGQAPQDVVVRGWKIGMALSWAADGKGLFVDTPRLGGVAILYLDVHGNGNLVWEQKGRFHLGGVFSTWAVSSPDSRHFAIMGWHHSSNAWMLEGF